MEIVKKNKNGKIERNKKIEKLISKKNNFWRKRRGCLIGGWADEWVGEWSDGLRGVGEIKLML